MKEKIKIAFLIILNILLIVITLLSLMIYTSLISEKLPWYEPCGMQFLAILFFSCPIFIVIGIIELILGKFINISRRLKLLPFLSCLGMGLPIFIDGGLGIEMQITGTIIGLLIIFLTIYFTAIDTLKLVSKSHSSIFRTENHSQSH